MYLSTYEKKNVQTDKSLMNRLTKNNIENPCFHFFMYCDKIPKTTTMMTPF